MKKIVYAILVAAGILSCDKVTNIYPPNSYDTDLNVSLYPGSWQTYLDTKWPNFDTIAAPTQINVLIDDFTGHNCQYCPSAAALAHHLHGQNPDRVFVSSIHAAPTGITGFQAVTGNYPVNFTNTNGLELATTFGNDPNLGFTGNPSVGANRAPYPGSTEIFYSAGALMQMVASQLQVAPLVKLKAVANYFASTKGTFLHIEAEKDPSITNNVGIIAVIQQDSLVAPQNVNATYTPQYVHRDIHLGNVGGNTWGVTLTDDLKKENGKYYVDYSFVLRDLLTLDGANNVHDPSGIHFLVYAYDKVTNQIYQVIKLRVTQ